MSRHQNRRPAAMSVGTRAAQASPLGDAVLRTARAPRRAANKVALAALATAPPALITPDAALVTVAALRCARLGVLRRPPDSVERAALSMLRRTSRTTLALRASGCTP